MRRRDRLLDLVARLSDGRLHRAEDLARALGVSARTIYRDMDTLVASGVPIAGTRGHGYAATAEVTLPPLNLTLDELEALHLGLAVVGEAGEGARRDAARSLSAKIDDVLPQDRGARGAAFGFATHAFAEASRAFRHVGPLRAAIRARQKVAVAMAGGRRVMRPLRLDYWGRVWTLVAWDETAGGFAQLRVDLVDEVRLLPQLFVDEPGRTLADHHAGAG